MKYKKYLKYKSSGIEWLGEIPEHWEVKRLGQYFQERNEKVSDKEYPPLSVTKQGIMPQLENVAKTNNNDNRKKVVKGDIVINSRSDRKGSSGLSNYTGSVSLINIVLVPKKINKKFSHYLIKSHGFKEEFFKYGKGIVDDLWSTHFNEMKNILIPLPPLSEQKAIATFLDKATEKIDNLIQKEEELIKLLEEKKEALITKAVTKGLKNAKMKDSGIEWLGEIPEHWEVRKLKYVARLNPKKSEIIKSNILVQFIPMEKLKRGKLELNEIKNMIDVYDSYIYFRENDILLAKVTPCFENRNIAIANNLKNEIGFGSSEIYVIRVNNEITRKFIYYLLQEENFVKFGQKEMTGTGGLKRVPSEFIENLKIPLPPLQEQKEITEYLDKKLAKIDKLIEKSKKAIELLKEKKEALITNAVTGKIDVRENHEA